MGIMVERRILVFRSESLWLNEGRWVVVVVVLCGMDIGSDGVDVVDVDNDIDALASEVEVGTSLSLLVSASSVVCGTSTTEEVKVGPISIELELELVGSTASGGTSADVATPYFATPVFGVSE